MRWLAALLALAACGSAEAELVTVVPPDHGEYALRLAADAGRLYFFESDLAVYTPGDDAGQVIGAITSSPGNIRDVAASDGHAFWFEGFTDIARADLDGNVDRVTGVAPRRLVARGGCAFWADDVSLMQWCPSGPAPVVVTAVGPGGTFTMDDDAFYWWSSDGLIRHARQGGAETLLVTGGGVGLGAPIAVDADAVYWIGDHEILSSVALSGGDPVDLGTIPTHSYVFPLLVDEHGLYTWKARLPRGTQAGEDWLPIDDLCRDVVVDHGFAYWICDGTREPIEHGTVVYRAATDGPAVIAPGVEGAGGEPGALRPPFL